MAIRGSIEDKTVLITGASSGLGRALSNESEDRGAKVISASRSSSEFQLDVRDPESVHELFGLIDEITGRIDVVINNAAIGHNNSIDDLSEEKIKHIIDTNLFGTMLITREAVKRMQIQDEGQIVFVSSLAGKLAFPNLSVYSATKFGIEGFAEAVREEVKKTDIDITVVRPGVMDTNFFETAGMIEFAQDMKGKMQNPREVAEKVLDAIEQNKPEVTIGSDKRFLFFLKHFPRSIARKLLPYIT